MSPSGGAGATGTPAPAADDVPVPPPVIQDAWQSTWSSVRVMVRSDAPHWTLRSCPTASDPQGSTVHAQGTAPKEVTVTFVKAFDWSLVDDPPITTLCAEAVSDDGAGRTSTATRTWVDVSSVPRIRAVDDSYSPLSYVPYVPAGRWAQTWFQATWNPPYRGGPLYETAVRGVPLEVRRRSLPSGQWIWMGRFTADRDGMIAVGYRHDGDTEFQACRPGTRCGTVLRSQRYGTKATVYSSAPATARRNTTFPIYATVLPRYAGRPVQLCENHGPHDCRAVSVRRTDANGRVVFRVHAGAKRTSRSWRVCSAGVHHGILGDTCSTAPVRNVRIR